MRALRVFGLDGGGSSSRLRAADEANRTLWEGSGPAVNPNAVEPGILEERFGELFARLRSEAGLGPEDFAAGCLGVAGADRGAEKAQLEGILRSRLGFSCPLVLCSDPEIALVGALRSAEGMILVAGTGSIAVARLASGERLRSGGWGHFLSDEGSGFFLGFQAVRRTLRSLEGRDLATGMLPSLLGHFGLEDSSGFVGLVYRRFDKAQVAAAAPLVLRAAAEGDPLARDIADEAVRELASLVSSLWTRVRERLANREVALWGGLLSADGEGAAAGAFRAALVGELARRCPGLDPVSPRESAAFGACALALRAAQGSAAS